MSLKRYLFLLIAGVVLLVAVIQLFFIHLIREQVAEEVSARSQAVSDVALKVLTRERLIAPQLPNTESESSIVIRVQSAPSVAVDLGDGMRFVTGDKTQIATVTRIPSAQRVSQADANVFLKRLGSSFGVNVTSADHTQTVQHIVQFDDSQSRINIYFTSLMAITAGLAFVGLALAYWLARHISRPLHALAGGFDRIAQGELGSQVSASGVGEVRAAIQHFNSMSERLQTMQELEQQLQQRNHLAELGDVARGLAHSLRNPLNTIGLAIEQMQQPGLSDTEREALARQTREKIQVMDKYIRHLLSLSDAHIKRIQPVKLLPVVQDLVLEVSFGQQQTIHYEVSPDVTLVGAEIELRSMLQVLLTNAVEATPASGNIELSVSAIDNGVKMTIIDSGEGCTAEVLSGEFKPHTSTKSEGAGMGLFITQRLAELHYGGSVTLANRPEGGCIATLILFNARANEDTNDN